MHILDDELRVIVMPATLTRLFKPSQQRKDFLAPLRLYFFIHYYTQLDLMIAIRLFDHGFSQQESPDVFLYFESIELILLLFLDDLFFLRLLL